MFILVNFNNSAADLMQPLQKSTVVIVWCSINGISIQTIVRFKYHIYILWYFKCTQKVLQGMPCKMPKIPQWCPDQTTQTWKHYGICRYTENNTGCLR